MSALTVDTIGVLVRRRVNAPVADRPRFETMVNDALASLAHKVAGREDFRELRTEIPVVTVAGKFEIADPSILIKSIPKTGLLILNGVICKAVERYEDLMVNRPKDVYWFVVRNRELHVANITTGALGVVAQNGTLEANYIPTLAQLPAAYDQELIDEVVELAGLGRSVVDSAPLGT